MSIVIAVIVLLAGCAFTRTVLRNGAHAAEYFGGSEAELTIVLKAASNGADTGAAAAQFADDVNRLTESADNAAVWRRLCTQAANWLEIGQFTPTKQEFWDMAVSAVAAETSGSSGVDDLQTSLVEWAEGRADQEAVLTSLQVLRQAHCSP
ncbi:hypothetical protein ACGGZK_08940 [Agromyces sp. MMS24-K17]|uniref:hypothetical protein n=1 Tax=Agromyces sp. MMS24-K17 TaxID=3372850 RepID=UPI0037544E2C